MFGAAPREEQARTAMRNRTRMGSRRIAREALEQFAASGAHRYHRHGLGRTRPVRRYTKRDVSRVPLRQAIPSRRIEAFRVVESGALIVAVVEAQYRALRNRRVIVDGDIGGGDSVSDA